MFPQMFGKYVLEREIASGGMARVYLATLRGAGGFEKRLVVKQIRPELASDDAFVKRFVEEAKTAVELSHPNIVPVYELGVEQGVYFIAMELCEGATLAELLADTGPLEPEGGAYVGVEICRALDYAHRRARIVHRDVTPRNVMIDEEGHVRLIDFGIATPVHPEAGRVEVFGSAGHMPPEQLSGSELTPAADVFAVGALLIEAWTGKPPFRRASAAASERALSEELVPLDVHDARLAPVAELVGSAVALEPQRRPQRAEALARPLRGFLKQADLGDIAARLGERVRRTIRRREARRVEDASDGTKPVASDSSASSAGSTTGPRTRPIGTRTFAQRNELSAWTRPLPVGDTEAESASSDGRLVERAGSDGAESAAGVGREGGAPAAGSEAGATRTEGASAAVAGDEAGATQAEGALATVAGDEAGATQAEGALAAVAGDEAGATRTEGLDRAAEEPLRERVVEPTRPDRGENHPHAGWKRALPLAGAAGLALVLGVGAGWLARAEPPESASLPRASSPSPLPEPTVVRPQAKLPAPMASASSSSAPAASAVAASAASPAPAPPSAAAAAPTKSCTLRLSAQPSASVTVGSRRFASVPVQVPLSPGSYLVTFRNGALDERVPAQVTLRAGETRSVHADFTGTRPTIRMY